MQNVYSTAVELRWPKAATGRPRKHPVPSEEPGRGRGQVLAGAAWRRVTWRRGTKGPLAAEFAALRVRPAEGAQLRNGRHLPGEEVWLVGERRASGERKYYLANLPAGRAARGAGGDDQGALGRASRRTSSSRRSWASTTSRAAPGPACTGTR